jgi:hypothetical protein
MISANLSTINKQNKHYKYHKQSKQGKQPVYLFGCLPVYGTLNYLVGTRSKSIEVQNAKNR